MKITVKQLRQIIAEQFNEETMTGLDPIEQALFDYAVKFGEDPSVSMEEIQKKLMEKASTAAQIAFETYDDEKGEIRKFPPGP